MKAERAVKEWDKQEGMQREFQKREDTLKRKRKEQERREGLTCLLCLGIHELLDAAEHPLVQGHILDE